MNKMIVWLDDRRISFHSDNEKFKLLKCDQKLISSPETKEELLENFRWFADEQRFTELVFISSTPKKIIDWFYKSFKVIKAAGGLIENNKKETLFIFRLGKWDLPKGKLEKGESIKEAAIRECEEECGISELKIKKSLSITYHMYEHKGAMVLKETFWFAMKSSFTGKLVPQTEEAIEKVIWAKQKDFKMIKANTYQNILEVIK